MIDKIQEKINKTHYWDLLILDVQTQYFGDEVYIYIEKNDKFCWKLTFASCYKVSYETDANWRGDIEVKKTGPKAGYYGQDISLKKYEADENFVQCSLNLSIMTMEIICKNIFVEEVEIKKDTFFWEDSWG